MIIITLSERIYAIIRHTLLLVLSLYCEFYMLVQWHDGTLSSMNLKNIMV